VTASGRRGVSLLDAVRSVDLVDIEMRDSSEKTLPPETFLRSARTEVLVTGPTLFTILKDSHENTGVFRQLLDQGVKVKLLIIHPIEAEREIVALGARVGKDLGSEHRQAIGFMLKQGLHNYSDCEVRFMPKLATYNAMVVDGDIGRIGLNTTESQMRIQPLSTAASTHSGLVLQFRKSRSGRGGYEGFIDDILLQWQQSKADAALLRMP